MPHLSAKCLTSPEAKSPKSLTSQDQKAQRKADLGFDPKVIPFPAYRDQYEKVIFWNAQPHSREYEREKNSGEIGHSTPVLKSLQVVTAAMKL